MDDKAKFITEKWRQGVQRRRPFDAAAQRNIGILMGDHNLVMDVKNGRAYKKMYSDSQTRLQIPLIKPIWRTELAKLTKNHPTVEIRPGSNSEADRKSAQIAQRVLDSELGRISFQEKYIRLGVWVTSVGTAYLHVYFDPSDGDNGNVMVEIVPHTQIVMDPAATEDSTQAKWCIHGKVMAPEEAYNVFGKEFKADAEDMSNYINNATQLQVGGIADNNRNGILVLRFWSLPTRKIPNGALVTVINGQIIEDNAHTKDKFPFKGGRLPFIDFHHVRIPGQFAGQAMIQDLWASQFDYDHTRSKKAEARALAVSQKLLSPDGALEGMSRLTNRPGEIIHYKSVMGAKPEYLQQPTLPGFVFTSMDDALREMQDISHIHDVSRGKAPSGTPASAVAMLQASDDTAAGVVIAGLEASMARYGQYHLQLVQQFWKQARVVKTWSESDGAAEAGKYIHDMFSGADIAGATDVIAIPGSGAPRSKQATSDLVLTLAREQLITDPNFIMKNLDMPGLAPLQMVGDKSQKQAEREDMKYMALNNKEETPEVLVTLPSAESWHTHETHITTHNDFRMSEEFEGLPDWVRAAVAEHVADHQRHVDEAQMKQQAQGALGNIMGAEQGMAVAEGMPGAPPTEPGMEELAGEMPEEGMPPEGMPPEGMPPEVPPEGMPPPGMGMPPQGLM